MGRAVTLRQDSLYNAAMEPTPELFAALRREEVADARRLSIAQKLALGGDLFDAACQVTLSGIRMQAPGISDEAAWAELRRRLDMRRRIEARQGSAVREVR